MTWGWLNVSLPNIDYAVVNVCVRVCASCMGIPRSPFGTNDELFDREDVVMDVVVDVDD